jgi:hypothetical protein
VEPRSFAELVFAVFDERYRRDLHAINVTELATAYNGACIQRHNARSGTLQTLNAAALAVRLCLGVSALLREAQSSRDEAAPADAAPAAPAAAGAPRAAAPAAPAAPAAAAAAPETGAYDRLAREALRSIFSEAPAFAAFFLSQLQPPAALQAFLSGPRVIEDFGLTEAWRTRETDRSRDAAARITMEAAASMPCVFDPTAPLGPEYAQIADILRRPTAAPLDISNWVARISQAPRGAAAGKLAARALLLLAMYHECFAQRRPCPAVATLIGTAAGKTALDLNAQEAEVYLRLAAGPIPNAPGMSETIASLFSTTSFEGTIDDIVWAGTRRAAAVNVMAYILGCPRDKTYCYTCAFKPEQLPGSIGPGGQYGHSKDCGYQVRVCASRE